MMMMKSHVMRRTKTTKTVIRERFCLIFPSYRMQMPCMKRRSPVERLLMATSSYSSFGTHRSKIKNRLPLAIVLKISEKIARMANKCSSYKLREGFSRERERHVTMQRQWWRSLLPWMSSTDRKKTTRKGLSTLRPAKMSTSKLRCRSSIHRHLRKPSLLRQPPVRRGCMLT